MLTIYLYKKKQGPDGPFIIKILSTLDVYYSSIVNPTKSDFNNDSVALAADCVSL